MFRTVKNAASNTIIAYTAIVSLVGLGQLAHDGAVALKDTIKNRKK